MDINNLNLESSKKSYISVMLEEHPEIFSGCLYIDGNCYELSSEVVESICKQSGVPATMNHVLKNSNHELWVNSVTSMYNHYYKGVNLNFLCEEFRIQNVSFKKTPPLLNTEFLKSLIRQVDTYSDILEIDSFCYDENSTTSEMIIFHREDHEYRDRVYKLGVVLSNDELNAVTCNLAVRYEDKLFYLPSKYYNLSSSRYSRSASNSQESLDLLFLRVLSDISSESWFSIIPTVDMNLQMCKKIPATYEEYRRVFRVLKSSALASNIEDTEDVLGLLEDTFSDFESNYPSLEDKKGSYIWRCSALSENSIYDLIELFHKIPKDHIFYPETLREVRVGLGELIMLNKLSTELAKRKV